MPLPALCSGGCRTKFGFKLGGVMGYPPGPDGKLLTTLLRITTGRYPMTPPVVTKTYAAERLSSRRMAVMRGIRRRIPARISRALGLRCQHNEV